MFSGRVKSKYKGPMLGVCLVLLRNIREAIWLVQGEKKAVVIEVREFTEHKIF